MILDTAGKMQHKYLNSTSNIVQYAVVAEVTQGQTFLRFSGESEKSPKVYKRFKSYVPAVGDRVMLINDVIVGGWV